jgi:uncharacterized membrane protein YphA (DoxX/SURF4 family)
VNKLEPWFLRVLAIVFGGVFVYAGVLKASDPGLFLIDVRSFDMLRDPYAAWLALGLPWLEIFAGLAVVTGVYRQSGLLILNLALVVFFIAISWAWHRGIDIKCGCFGKSDASSNHTWLFTRDGVLLVLGGLTMWLENRRISKTS